MKQKKTRQQKVIADLRRKLQTASNAATPLQTMPEKKIMPPIVRQQNSTLENTSAVDVNQYLINDLSKTVFLTGLIVLAEFFLFVLLKNQIFVLPKISF